MYIVILIVFAFAFIMDTRVRIAFFHLPSTLYYAVKDTYFYFKHKNYNRAPEGNIWCYCAHFGGGKTLTATQYVAELYRKYNDKYVWDRERKKFVLQKVHIISNVKFNTVPYEPLNNISQIVNNALNNKSVDMENDTLTVIIAFIDESSSEMNSRNFKSNIDPEFLRVLVTERHYHMNFLYSSQKFKLSDALMRSVTQTCIWCEKTWRFMVNYYYDADEMENVSDPTLLKPYKKKGWLIWDKHFNEYDTYALVGELKKKIDAGDLMTPEEILVMRGQLSTDMDAVTPSRKYIKRVRKMHK